MRIFLADTSDDRGQYGCLVEEGYRNFLFSYAYRTSPALPAFQFVWNQLMHVHFAATGAPITKEQFQQALIAETDSSLFSYAYKEDEKHWAKIWHPSPGDDKRARVIIDSGAFTAFSSGKVISPRDYAEWSIGLRDRWQHKLSELYFMNLDVIGDQNASWENHQILESLGLDVLPIVTFGADMKHLDRAMENYPYIALGGLVPYASSPKKLRVWLDKCFKRIMAYRRTSGQMPRVHLLGITTEWVLNRYPAFSSDSSSWVACLRFGRGTAAGIAQLPRYKESDAAMNATVHALRSEIRKYKGLEVSATKLWRQRNVVWENQ